MWVDQREDVLRAADVLTENGIFIEAGPSSRIGRRRSIYIRYEPGGNRVEIYSGSYFVLSPDWEPVTWNETSAGRRVLGWRAADSFIKCATPDVAESAAPAGASRCRSGMTRLYRALQVNYVAERFMRAQVGSQRDSALLPQLRRDLIA